jgi:hypothetical protein
MDLNPVGTNGVIAIVSAVLTPILLHLGLDAEGAGQAIGVLVSIATGVLTIYHMVAVRRKVTPVANPHNNIGQPLTPIGQ